MAQTSITLTASMRSNLSSLKSIQSQMDKTQDRLSTGKKVNSAIDNASSYYQARSLTNRASDLDSLLDSMGQGIQTIQAANEGIEAITSYVEQLKSVATSAYALDASSTTYPDELAKYEDQYNSILSEIATLAKDSSYQGVNLLKGNTLTVMFNESRSHSLVVESDDVVAQMQATDSNGFSWNVDANGNQTTGNVSWDAVEGTHSKVTITTMKTVTATDVQTGGVVDSEKLKSGVHMVYDAVAGNWRDAKATDAVGDIKVVDTVAAPVYKTEAELASINESATQMVEKSDLLYDAAGNKTGFTEAEVINKSLDAIAAVNSYLRSYTTELGNNFTIIETRQQFTDALVDVLETGADNLILADMNEESANYLALQTRQQLAVNSLSLASQSAQSVLKLF